MRFRVVGLGRGAAMIIESLRLFYHIGCFRCCVCGIALGNGTAGTDVRVRNNHLHFHDCYSNDDGKPRGFQFAVTTQSNTLTVLQSVTINNLTNVIFIIGKTSQ